jgi:hypothetical protein
VPPLLLLVVVVVVFVVVVFVAGFEVVTAAAPPLLVVSFELDPHPTPTAAPSASAAINATARYENTDHLWRSICSSCWDGIDSLKPPVSNGIRVTLSVSSIDEGVRHSGNSPIAG